MYLSFALSAPTPLPLRTRAPFFSVKVHTFNFFIVRSLPSEVHVSHFLPVPATLALGVRELLKEQFIVFTLIPLFLFRFLQ